MERPPVVSLAALRFEGPGAPAAFDGQ